MTANNSAGTKKPDMLCALPPELHGLNEFQRYRQAAEAHDLSAIYLLGWMYANGRGVVRDDAEAVRWYRQAAEAGHVPAMSILCWIYRHGCGVPRDDDAAAKWFQRAAAVDDAGIMAELGWMHGEGYGAPQDDLLAAMWFQTAAAAGNSTGMARLGAMYRAGRGVPRDDAEAVKWLQKAAGAGNTAGMASLGTMYRDGRGLPQDDAEAVRWFGKAAEAGNAHAMIDLGWMYYHGRGVPQDDAAAVLWYRKADAAGHVHALLALHSVSPNSHALTRAEREALSRRQLSAEYRLRHAHAEPGGMFPYDFWALWSRVRGNRALWDAINSIGMSFMAIKPGTFVMGSPDLEMGRFNDETPHQVTLTRGYLMQITPVTQAQWHAVMGSNPSHFSGHDLPVEQVSRDDAAAFCRKLSQREGKAYRLPSEAEWEYACRAGTTTAYYRGDDEQALAAAGWYSGNSTNQTHPVGQKQPNAWGLCDMHGNVYQWCSDWYGDYPHDAVTDPTRPSTGRAHVIRGGSWSDQPPACRCGARAWRAPDRRSLSIGFRVVLDLN